ncbi:hypothetical protein [Streptomyces sp. NPDC059009]|uniref:hypothetical protein n=1 Tax=Streptomyces sp. NPDC059009 TaxID=3346694 RepID=UPI0036B0C8DC
MSERIIATTDDGRFRVRLFPDPNMPNPREDPDTHVHVITIDTHLGQHRPVDRDGGPLADAWHRICWNRWKGVEIFTRYVEIMHGGIVLESTPDSGPRSLWYMTHEELIDLDFGLLSEAYVEAEKEDYESWLAKDVWGFSIEQAAAPGDATTEWKQIYTETGHYGGAYARADARKKLEFFAKRAANNT